MELLTLREYLWLFLIYAFLGWVLETAAAALKQRRFVNRGLINGPFCMIYGFTALLLSVVLQDMTGVHLAFFAMLYATGVEWITGHLIELIWKERWWDYRDIRWNIGGYICLPASVLWGLLGYAVIRFINPFLLTVFADLPNLLITVALWVVLIGLAIDIMADAMLLVHHSSQKELEAWENANHTFTRISIRLSRSITGFIARRLARAYPNASKVQREKPGSGVFAKGVCFDKIVYLFVIGAFLGDVTETIFMRITAGTWMSRSSVIWGPFSLVWGLAIALMTALLHKYQDSSDRYLFVIGTVAGTAFEYLCSVFTELAFGRVFWNYSHIPFNLAGRVNLLFSFFWGIAAVVWFKMLFPPLSRWIERIPVKVGKTFTWLLLIFMIVDSAASAAALKRCQDRGNGVPAANAAQVWLDEHYDDARMKQIYPKAVVVKS